MPTGYLVTLGDGNLDAGDAISDGAVTFTADSGSPSGLGAGQWTWSGTAGGTSFTNEVEDGQYWLADDGNVYFEPSLGVVDTITSSSAITTPPYSASDGVVDGTSGDDVIGAGFVDSGGDAVDGSDGDDDTINGAAGDDIIDGGAGDDIIEGSSGSDVIAGGTGNDTIYGGNDSGAGGLNNLLINGSFEDGTHTANGVDGLYGWSNASGTPDAADDGGASESWNATNDASEGTGYVTMWTYADGTPGEAMQQTFATPLEAGETYTLTFDAISADNVGGTWFTPTDIPVRFEIVDQATGTVLGSTTVQGTSYEQYSFDITPTTPVGTIILRPATEGVGTYPSVILDNISLTEAVADDDDDIDGGFGDDVIYAQGGSDTVEGGAGNDTIDLGDDSDRDSLVTSDGSGDDVVTNFDMVDFGDGTTIDQIDVSDLTDSNGDPVNAWDVVVTDTNGDGTGDAILNFPNGETVTLVGVSPSQVDNASELNSIGIPCFTTGTQIATLTGNVTVETLRVGDLVSTLEYGPIPVRWIASSDVGDGAAPLPENVAPVRIKSGAMGNRLPLIVSPQHCILMRNRQTGENLFVRAKHLAQETRLASFAHGRKRVAYVHVLLGKHATLISNDIPSESFYPGPIALGMLPTIDRMKLYALIPDLICGPVEQAYGPRAAPVLMRKELRLMVGNRTLACLEYGLVAD